MASWNTNKQRSLKVFKLEAIDHFDSMISDERNPQANHQSIQGSVGEFPTVAGDFNIYFSETDKEGRENSFKSSKNFWTVMSLSFYIYPHSQNTNYSPNHMKCVKMDHILSDKGMINKF